MDEILDDMTPVQREWLYDFLSEAVLQSDNTYVQAEYQDTQDAVGSALWEIANLVKARL